MRDKNNTQKTMAEIRKQQDEWLAKFGYYVHYVFGDQNINCHTHGLSETLSHLDLQITLPILQETAHGILNNVTTRIKKGDKFKDEDRASEILEGYDVLFKKAAEGDRIVLRIILPDEKGLFPQDEGCNPVYKNQWPASKKIC